MNYYTENFRQFFDRLNVFEKNLILWCSIYNQDCPIDFCENLIKNNIDDKEAIMSNFEGNRCINKKNYNEFTNAEFEDLLIKMKTLDGTLLHDIIARNLRAHNIFEI